MKKKRYLIFQFQNWFRFVFLLDEWRDNLWDTQKSGFWYDKIIALKEIRFSIYSILFEKHELYIEFQSQPTC